MKNLLLFLLLIIVFRVESQQIVRPTHDYYLGDPTTNRTDRSRAIMDGVKLWQESGFQEMEIPLVQPDLKMRFPKLDFGFNKVEFSKDTIIQIDASPEPYHMNLRHYFHQYGQDIYTVYYEELDNQPTKYKLDTIVSQDETQVTRQYFFTDFWKFSKREANTLDSLRIAEWTPFGFHSGYAYFNNHRIIGTDTLRRHTQSFETKFYQVRALDTTFNTIDELRIYGNPLMPIK